MPATLEDRGCWLAPKQHSAAAVRNRQTEKSQTSSVRWTNPGEVGRSRAAAPRALDHRASERAFVNLLLQNQLSTRGDLQFLVPLFGEYGRSHREHPVSRAARSDNKVCTTRPCRSRATSRPHLRS